MNPVVTARVPEGVRDRGLEVLAEMGATTSELINAAFEYVIAERRLPKPRLAIEAQGGRQRLEREKAQSLRQFFDDVKVPVPESWADVPFEALLDQAMEGRYAGLR